MKKWLSRCLMLIVFVGCLNADPASVSAQPVLDYMQVIPEPGQPVRLQPTGAVRSIEITSIRSISSPTEIASDNPSPFTVICSDLTKIAVLPGETFACPEPPVLMAMVAILPPPPIIIPLDPGRGKELVDLTREERKVLGEAGQLIEQLDIEERFKQFLLANLYATYELYDDAISLLEKQSEKVEDDSAILCLLGTLHLRNMAPDLAYEPFAQALHIVQDRDDTEGQAVARYYLAKTFEAQGQYDALFEQHAREALKLFQELGYAGMIKTVEELLQHAR